jgi:hypothetical protein
VSDVILLICDVLDWKLGILEALYCEEGCCALARLANDAEYADGVALRPDEVAVGRRGRERFGDGIPEEFF